MEYKYNEGGRGEHYKGLVGDCVTRAITIATELPYDVVYNALFDIAKNKDATAKDKTGKILESRIILNSKIIIKDYLTNKEILNQNFFHSSIYTIQDLYSETIKLENKSTKDLIDKTYQDLLIKMSEIN